MSQCKEHNYLDFEVRNDLHVNSFLRIIMKWSFHAVLFQTENSSSVDPTRSVCAFREKMLFICTSVSETKQLSD